MNKLKKIIVLFVCSTWCMVPSTSLFSQSKEGGRFQPKCFIVKLKITKQGQSPALGDQQALLSDWTKKLGSVSVERLFPGHDPLPVSSNENVTGEKIDLSLFYRVTYDGDLKPDEAIRKIGSQRILEYLEPEVEVDPLFVPDDEKLSNQYYLNNIHAYEAWDLCTGDSSVVVGIVDSGTDLDHEDLEGHVKINMDEPIDGVDNDNDGFIDNRYGWDLGEMDPDPQVTGGTGNEAHGVHMCGIAAASTNNGIGVAGVGFDCRFLPVKVSDAQGAFVRGYEGIVYAADHGCKVINCSWGSLFPRGQFGQDIVNYATFNRDALVVAACGNSDNDLPFYPASYEHVLSVGATGPSDERMIVSPGYASNYGAFIDVCAPGKSIFNTWNFPYFYKTLSGTSMAAAVTSGAAALVRSAFPQLSALQVAERLRVTSDRIDTLAPNLPFQGRLGMGRINLYRALTDTMIPSIRVQNPHFTDLDNDLFEPGDTVYLTAVFQNLLAMASQAEVTLSCDHPLVQMLDTLVSLGDIPTLGSASNLSHPFVFRLLPGINSSESVELRLTYHTSSNTSFEYLVLNLNSGYLTIETEQLKTTLTSTGRLGYNDDLCAQGAGFCYQNDLTRMRSGGFLIGTTYTRVSDATLNAVLSGSDPDFIPLERIHENVSPLYSDKEYEAVYNDDGAGSLSLPVKVVQKTMSWEGEENSGFVIHELRISNTGSTVLSNLYAGLFADWDINPFASDYEQVTWDSEHLMGITSNGSSGPVLGISLLTEGPAKHYAFDFDGSNGSIRLDDGFTTQEKYSALKTNRHQAGATPGGNNVADLISSGPHLLFPGDSLIVAFAQLAAGHVAGISGAASRAWDAYHQVEGMEIPANDSHGSVSCYPNPAKDVLYVTFNLTGSDHLRIFLTDETGRQVMNPVQVVGNNGSNLVEVPVRQERPGIYQVVIQGERCWLTTRCLVLR